MLLFERCAEIIPVAVVYADSLGFAGMEDSNNGKMSTVWQRAAVWKQSPLVQESHASPLGCQYSEGDDHGRRQARVKAAVHGLSQDGHQILSKPEAVKA